MLLRFTYLGQELGRVSMMAEQIEPGRFQIGGSHLSLAGAWQIDVVVRRRGIEDSVAWFHWTLAPPGGARPVVVSQYPLKAPLTFAATGTLLLVLMAVAWTWRIQRWPQRRTHSRYAPHTSVS